MKNLFLYILFILAFSDNVFPQILDSAAAKSFINSLIYHSDDLVKFVYKKELDISNRLGISYNGKPNKFLISNEFEDTVKLKLRNKTCDFKYYIKPLEDQYSLLTISIPSINKKIEYYFYKSKLVSKIFYLTRNWQTIESNFFMFHCANLDLINKYAINKLDKFILNMCDILEFDTLKIKKLKNTKIHYFLCKDENEIEKLTNYKTRGMFFLPYDYIVSTYNNHYHEILHLLINYKLQSVDLYTLPILQEGFAVAFGGRGGKEPNVILNMGAFLEESNFLNYDSILSKSEFYHYDPTLTYPISGLYVKFLIENKGMSDFIRLYKKYSTDISEINSLKIDLSELPKLNDWSIFLKNQESKKVISISKYNENDFDKVVFENKDAEVFENNVKYLVKLKDKIFIKSDEVFTNYKSNLFNELFPSKKYKGEKYLISANNEEISVYNFLTNTLIAKYVKSFSLNTKPIEIENGYFVFTIDKNLFDKPITKENIN